MIFDDILFTQHLLTIIFEKGIIGLAILYAGYIVKKSIERGKSDDILKNEITRIRIERISSFYDLFSAYEHWINRLLIHAHNQIVKNEDYLSEIEFKEATLKSLEISSKIGYELNQMRFWINDDIYFHTVTQLDLLKTIKTEVILNRNIENI